VVGIAGTVAVLLLSGSGLLKSDEGLTEEARSLIEENYYEPVPGRALDQASVTGMVRELRDRFKDSFSHYFPPNQLDEFQALTSGKFSGVGLTVTGTKRGLRVVSVLPNTPAEKAKISEGDEIIAVDGRSLAGVSERVSAARIKGKPGTKVELRIDPAKQGEPVRDINVERADVRVPVVDGTLRRAGGKKVGYVRFAAFSEGAHGELRKEVERLVRQGAQGIVLDLRGNGGGLLDEAVLTASVFIREGVIVTTKSRTQGDKTYEAVGDSIEAPPMVVLTNRDTASAAEILTAALEEYEIATVVGTRTFGKGVFQEVIHLDAGGALDLTVGEYFTASGESLFPKGIDPEVRAADKPATRPDEALDVALDELGTELGGSPAP
jgi:carboxyl-terminal processing protease